VPKPYPKEFRDDVVRVAANREPGVTLEQIASDRGSPDDAHEKAQRNWLLEQEVEVLRRAAVNLGQAQLPGKGSTRSWQSSPVTGSP
jgi:transposase